jgi:L-alanine-DL-glutamate epimerase-like enolase superfamily enzyme
MSAADIAGQGRIARIDAFTVSVPFTAPEETATLQRHGFDNVIVRLETAEGVIGWGETSGASGAPVEAVRATIDSLLPLVVGMRVFETERLRADLIRIGRLANFRRLAHLAAAAFDIACWDAAGKLLGRPVHELIGGALRRDVDFYAYPLAKTPEEVAAEARAFVDAGYSVVYLKVGLGDARDLDTVARVREAVGPQLRIRVDANEAWDLATARRLSTRLEPFSIDFIEQPIDARDLLGMRELRKATRIALAANQGIWSIAEAQQAIRLESCDVIVTGPLWLGGLLPLQQLGVVCAESGIGFCRHTPPETSITTAAGLHALATLPRLLDGNQTYYYYLAEDVSDSLGERRVSRLAVPDGPGLGIEVDERRIAEMARRYSVDGGFRQNIRAPGPAT